MDRLTLRDWAIRLNEQGHDGPINVPHQVAPAKLNVPGRMYDDERSPSFGDDHDEMLAYPIGIGI
jgi:hypothetical protein